MWTCTYVCQLRKSKNKIAKKPQISPIWTGKVDKSSPKSELSPESPIPKSKIKWERQASFLSDQVSFKVLQEDKD